MKIKFKPIGMTVVKLIQREKNILTISGVDMIEGTPILDIKPYLSRDKKVDIRVGWIENTSYSEYNSGQ